MSLQQIDIEHRWQVAVGGNLVGGRAIRDQPPGVVPLKLLTGQPAHALNEAALYLADVDGWVE